MGCKIKCFGAMQGLASGNQNQKRTRLRRVILLAFMVTISMGLFAGCSGIKQAPELNESDIIEDVDAAEYGSICFYPSDETDDGYRLTAVTVDEVVDASSLYNAVEQAGDGIDLEQSISSGEIVSKKHGYTPSDISDHYEANAPTKVVKCTLDLENLHHSVSLSTWTAYVYTQGVWRIVVSCPHGVTLN